MSFSKTHICCLAILLFGLQAATEAQQPRVEKFLVSGQLSQGELELERHLADNPGDDQARFGLGTLRLMQSVEHLAQSWYQFGINDDLRQVPFFRLPVDDNPNPQRVSYQDVRNVFKNMIEHLDAADEALSQVKSKQVKLPLHLFQFHLDINQDGKLQDSEDLMSVYRLYFGNAFQPAGNIKETVVVFDYSDVLWMRGYTHLLRSMLETALAYDQEALWDVVGHRVFQQVDFKFKFLEEEYEKRKQAGNQNRSWFYDEFAILDIVAGVHNLNFKLREPARMKRAHGHLKKMISLSREMWVSIKSETDNDREWIPSPEQKSAVATARINQAMITTWGEFLDEMEAILDGKKLVPFWRGTDKTRGVNFQKFFLEPRDLDIVLWAHGSGAAPYIEFGDVSSGATWNRFQRVFRGEFFGFAVWFN